MSRLEISEQNPMLIAYQKYLQMNYSSPKTRYLYEIKARSFLSGIYNKTKTEPLELTQGMLDDFVIWINMKKNTNPFYRAFIKSFRLAFDPDEKIFRLKTKLDRSRIRSSMEEYDWLTKESVDKIIEKGEPYISMMVATYFDTGARLSELINVDLNNTKDWDLDLVKRTIKGLGKGNAEFRKHFSKQTADKIYKWIISPQCVDKTKPFMLFKKDGSKYNNPSSALDYLFKNQCKLLGVKDVHGKEPHIHCLRHAIGRYLTQEKGWKIEQTAIKLGHKKLDNTKKYASPDIEQIEAKEDAEVFNEN